jgi:hypothetical protein
MARFRHFINKFDIDFLTGYQYNNRCETFGFSIRKTKIS